MTKSAPMCRTETAEDQLQSAACKFVDYATTKHWPKYLARLERAALRFAGASGWERLKNGMGKR